VEINNKAKLEILYKKRMM